MSVTSYSASKEDKGKKAEGILEHPAALLEG